MAGLPFLANRYAACSFAKIHPNNLRLYGQAEIKWRLPTLVPCTLRAGLSEWRRIVESLIAGSNSSTNRSGAKR